MAKHNKEKPQWNVGDVYAYKLESDLAKERGLFEEYFLVQKIHEEEWSVRNRVPIVYIKITKDGNLPTNTEEYDQLEYVQTRFTKYENRFHPLDFSQLEADLARKATMTYKVDEYGLLPQFRTTILKPARVTIPKELFFVGSFPDAQPPKIEFIPHHFLNQRLINWTRNAELFERLVVTAYCNYNRRELEIYKRM